MDTARVRGVISRGLWRQHGFGGLSLGVHGDRTGEGFISKGSWGQHG